VWLKRSRRDLFAPSITTNHLLIAELRAHHSLIACSKYFLLIYVLWVELLASASIPKPLRPGKSIYFFIYLLIYIFSLQ